MVDFKRASLSKKLKIICDGHVNEVKDCNNEAVCYFEFKEDNEDGPMGEHFFCETCMYKLFPRSSEEGIEESKLDMFGYKYRICKEGNRITYNHYGKPEEYPDGYIPPFMCVLEANKDYHAGWYFFDECGFTHGPFETFEETKELLRIYGETL